MMGFRRRWAAMCGCAGVMVCAAMTVAGDRGVSERLGEPDASFGPVDPQCLTARFAFGFGGDSEPGRLESPRVVAVGPEGKVYAGDASDGTIQVFDIDGTFERLIPLRETLDVFGPPNDLAVDSTGRLVMTFSTQVFVTDAQGELLFELAGNGGDPGDFLLAFGVAIDDQDRMYIVDAHRDRILVYDPQGTLLFQFGEPGVKAGQFDTAADIAIGPDGRMYVTDVNNNRVQVFDPDGTFVSMFGTPGDGPGLFDQPVHIAVDNQHRVFIVDFGESEAEVYTLKGTLLFTFGDPDPPPFSEAIEGMAIHPSGRPVAAVADRGVLEVYGPEGTLERSIGNPPGHLDQTFDVKVSVAGEVLAVTENAVNIFDANGGFLRQIGEVEGEPGSLLGAIAIDIDERGRIYVLDRNDNRVKVFDADENFLFQFGATGSGPGEFDNPTGVAVAPDGRIAVADLTHQRVQMFDQTGLLLYLLDDQALIPGGLGEPVRLDFDRQGFLYITDGVSPSVNIDRIVVFDENGDFVRTIGTTGSLLGQFSEPVDIRVSDDGRRLFVAESGNGRIQILEDDRVTVLIDGFSDGAVRFGQPLGVEFDETSGRLYIADVNDGIKVFNLIANEDNDDNGIPDCLETCPGDCVPPGGDGVINIDDILTIVISFGQVVPEGACDVAPDNGDGTVGDGVINLDDLNTAILNFGTCPGGI